MSLLEVRDLEVEHRRPDGSAWTVLKIPEFRVEASTQVCLKGRSGSGKTTLLNVLSGIRAPTRGSILMEGQDLSRLSEARRDLFRGAHFGFIFQTFNLLPGFTALENVILGSVFAGDPNEEPSSTRERASDLLKKVGLGDRMGHRPCMLSSGEQQRVAIARALMNRPKLVLADEPTGSLDERNGLEVLELIRTLLEECKASLLIVTHDPAVMARFKTVVDLKDLNKAVI